MKQKLLFLKMFAVGVLLLMGVSAKAITDNVELIANGDFSGAALLSQSAIAADATTGVWIAGDNTKTAFTPSISGSGAAAYFTSTSTANSTNLYDHFLGQITTELLTTGRYRISLKAKGDQPFYLKISGTNLLGTEYISVVKNAVGSVDRTGTGGYSIKFTPASASAFGTIQADLDITIPTSATARMYFVFPTAGTVALDDISLKRTMDIPVFTTYYLRPTGDLTSWNNLVANNTIQGDQIITATAIAPVSTNNYYFAPGTYTFAAGMLLTTGKFYGGFSGLETSIDLNTRVCSDKDMNGIIEPWEFTNEAIIKPSGATWLFAAAGVTSNRLIVIQGGEANGITFTDFHVTGANGAITLGAASSGPTAANDVDSNKGTLTMCTVKMIRDDVGGIISLNNKNSLVDRCLIESNVAASNGIIYMQVCGGKITKSVIRNNYAGNSNGTINATSSNTVSSASIVGATAGDMLAIVENCLIYNNTAATGGGIRCSAQSGKRGIQIVNTTIVNNKTTTANSASVVLTNSGAIANSLIVNPTNEANYDLLTNTANSYLASTIYNDESYTANGFKSNVVTGKVTSDIGFKSATANTNVMIPSYTASFDQTVYDAIRQANFSVYNSGSVAITTTSLSTLPTSYTYNTSSTSTLTATVPTTDITGLTRTGAKTLGAYQATHTVASGVTETISQPTTLASLTVAAGGKLTINSGIAASIGTLTLESDASGTATMLNSGTFTGTVNAKQYLGSARNWYVSSPVEVTNSPANNITRYYEYVEAGNNEEVGITGSTAYWKGLSTGTSMTVGKGYIAQSSAETTVQFSGTPNNGPITTNFNLTRNDAKGKGFNLVGNPYPSYIDWSLVAGANLNLMSTAWFKTKKTAEFGGGYTFASVNVTTPSSPEIVSNNANTTVTKYIPPTQAFWVRVNSGTASTSMNFTNAMREHRLDNGDLMKAPKMSTRSRLRIQLANGIEADETLIYFDNVASNDFNEYDSPKMMNNSSATPDLYTKAGIERLVINGLNAIADNMELPLGFSLNAAASLKLKATEMSNFPVGTRIYLLDKVDNVQTELLPETTYSFSTKAATINNESRFSLIFRTQSTTTGVENAAKVDAQVYVNAANQIAIIAPEKSNYAIYNAVGQLIENGILNYKLYTTNYKLTTGVYVVKVNNQTARVIIK